MERLVRTSRPAAVVAVALFSFLGALAAVSMMLRVGIAPGLGTPVLSGVLALLVLPIISVVAWQVDRASRKQ